MKDIFLIILVSANLAATIWMNQMFQEELDAHDDRMMESFGSYDGILRLHIFISSMISE
jgi:hypothetical protein